jgi:dihydrofolate reductase
LPCNGGRTEQKVAKPNYATGASSILRRSVPLLVNSARDSARNASNSHKRWYTKKGGLDNQMRNVIYAINTTLDGCVDHTKQFVDDETLEYFTHLLRDVDLQVFGRKTYQLMVPYWPEVAKNPSETKADHEFARTFVSINKIVFSRSLGSAEDRNTRIVRTSLHDEILKLKQEQGKNILVGGVSVPSQLIELGLVDEYRFVFGPIIAGEGRRLLEGVSLREKLQLKLADSKLFKSGCVALRYLKQ